MFPWALLRRKRVHLVTKDDRTFRGIVWARRGPLVVLREVEQLASNSRTPMDGEVVVERSNISYFQIVTGE